MSDDLVIAGQNFQSRLMVGTGRHRTTDEMKTSIEASGCQIITVAIGRIDLSNPDEETILDHFDWDTYTILPNTAGSTTAEQAVLTARLGREVTGSNWVKLEVIPNASHLMPDPIGTFSAAKELIDDGFTVLPYIHADPVLADKLENLGCATVMPLGSGIGTGQGIQTMEEISLIVENASVPVVVDAGLAVPSDASRALEAGADAVLVNTAIAQANEPKKMASAFRHGVEAGRTAYLAGRIERKDLAIKSSPGAGVPS